MNAMYVGSFESMRLKFQQPLRIQFEGKIEKEEQKISANQHHELFAPSTA